MRERIQHWLKHLATTSPFLSHPLFMNMTNFSLGFSVVVVGWVGGTAIN